MWNWIKFIVAFMVIITSVLIITILYNANKPLAAAKELATQQVLQTGQLKAVEKVTVYNGTQSGMTVFGKAPNGEQVAIFVTDDKQEQYEELHLKEGITAKQAADIVKAELEVEKVLHVSLGIESEGPVWEVAFTNKAGKLNYVYVLFENGKWWKRILNL